MHFIVIVNSKSGQIEKVQSYENWENAFKQYSSIMKNSNNNILIHLLDAENRNELEKLFGKFFY